MINEVTLQDFEGTAIEKSYKEYDFQKALSNELEKAQALPEGTIRYHGGRKVMKRQGKWVPISQKRSFEGKLHEFYEWTVSKHSEFEDFTHEIARQYEGEAVVAPPKSFDRVKEKTKQDYGGNFKEVKDILRSTIVVSSKQQAYDLVDKLTADYKVKKHWADFEKEGYNGANVVMEIDGRKAEIQINTPVNLALKDNELNHPAVEKTRQILKDSGIEPGQGHVYYEKIRSLDHEPPKEVTQQMISYFELGKQTLEWKATT